MSMNENIKALYDVLETMDSTLRAIHYEVNQLIMRVEVGKEGLRAIDAILPAPGRPRDPLDAPEVIGADKDGDGGTVIEDVMGEPVDD